MSGTAVSFCRMLAVLFVYQIAGGSPVGHMTEGEKGPPPGAPLVREEGHVVLRALLEVTTEPATTTTPAPAKSFSQQVAEFYSDDNNLAMFLVLPLIVLIYGGCSAIYCVAKCRRYLRRRHHKKLKQSMDSGDKQGEATNDLNQGGTAGQQESQAKGGSTAHNVNASSSDIRVNMVSRGTPLPGMTVEEEAPLTSNGSPPPPTSAQQNSRTTSSQQQQKHQTSSDAPLLSSRSTSQKSITSEASLGYSGDKGREEIPLVAPLHSKSESYKIQNRIFASSPRADSQSGGRSSALAYKEELMAKYEALTTLAMAKKAADILRMNTDTGKLDPKKPKKKMIFIAE